MCGSNIGEALNLLCSKPNMCAPKTSRQFGEQFCVHGTYSSTMEDVAQ